MNIVLKNILQLIESKNITSNQLQNELNLSNNAVTLWKKRDTYPKDATLSKIAEYFERPLSYFYEDHTQKPPIPSISTYDMISIPIMGIIAAGYDSSPAEQLLGNMSVMPMSLHGYPSDECIILQVYGESMAPKYLDGDYVLIHRQESVDSGTIAAILYNGDEVTLKKVKYVYGEDWLELIPLNQDYPKKRIEGPAIQECRVLGKLLGLVWREA